VSAGTGLVVWALEDLGSARVTAAVLISSSLAAKYDLTSALDKVSESIYTFNSLTDAVLGVGVPMTGTVDQEGELAGGLVGFSPPNNASDAVRKLYKDKLVQTWWWPGDVVLGHLGDHLGATNSLYVRARIAPMVFGHKAAGKSAASAMAAKTEEPVVTSYVVDPPPAAQAASTAVKNKETSRFVEWYVGAPPLPERSTSEEGKFLGDPGSAP
jgi:hypothetical protein